MRVVSFLLRGLVLASAAALVLAGSAGASTAPVKRCGGSIGIACGPNEYCKLANGACHRPVATGVCTVKPKLCPQIYAPVCGCNNKTYSNSCEAAAAGVSILHNGKCLPVRKG